MKRYCKDIDITNRKFIKEAILTCLSGGENGKAKYSRTDTLKMFHEYSHLSMEFLKGIAKTGDYYLFDGIINTIAEGIRSEIINREYTWKPIWHKYHRENEKVRKIGIQDIKQQLYDYIAVNGLKEVLVKKIGYYQCAAIPKKGQMFAKDAIKKWLRNPAMKYAWKGDAKHYYENINTHKLKKLLERCVKNEPLLHLTFALIDSFEKGLEIGSYLSQYLANFYMSFAYHYASEELFKVRNHRNGTSSRVRLISHVIIYMDDILFLGKSSKDLKMAVKRFKKWVSKNLDITIKKDEKWMDLKNGYIDMVGFYISPKKTIVRRRIFIRYRRLLTKIKRAKMITNKQARRMVSLDGWLQNADCRHWRKRNKAEEIIKMCKETISNEKNVIRFTTTKGHYRAVA